MHGICNTYPYQFMSFEGCLNTNKFTLGDGQNEKWRMFVNGERKTMKRME